MCMNGQTDVGNFNLMRVCHNEISYEQHRFADSISLSYNSSCFLFTLKWKFLKTFKKHGIKWHCQLKCAALQIERIIPFDSLSMRGRHVHRVYIYYYCYYYLCGRISRFLSTSACIFPCPFFIMANVKSHIAYYI